MKYYKKKTIKSWLGVGARANRTLDKKSEGEGSKF